MPQTEIHKLLEEQTQELEADTEWNSNAMELLNKASAITDSEFFFKHITELNTVILKTRFTMGI